MKKPQVDLREFRLSRINEPRFSHLKYLLGWVGYFILYFLTENLIPAEKCHAVHIAMDDIIPFNELFAIPYVFWYVLIVITLLYFAVYNPEGFKRFMSFIIVTQVVAMAVYIIYPTKQELRPESFERENVLTWLMGTIYSFDTNTGVCPSLHVAYSLGIASAWLKERDVSRLWKVFVCLAVLMICLSTMFVKQHSALDVFAAIPLGILAEIIAYGKHWWRPRLKRRKA